MPLPFVDLYWIPLGAGQHVVRLSGRLYEAFTARLRHREPCDLYHSALVIGTPDAQYAVEMAPIPDGRGPRDRGVVAEGAVGLHPAGRVRRFRYEIRRWPDGDIPDLPFAVASPVRVTDDPEQVRLVLDLVGRVPTPTWGRDELHTGEMWNSNSVTSWVLARAGVIGQAGRPPEHGRAPGWDAGLAVAARRDG